VRPGLRQDGSQQASVVIADPQPRHGILPVRVSRGLLQDRQVVTRLWDNSHHPAASNGHSGTADLSKQRIKRCPVLGGLINEYERAA
jgi:hypothetical protein